MILMSIKDVMDALFLYDNPFNPVFIVWWKCTYTAEHYNVNMIPDEANQAEV